MGKAKTLALTVAIMISGCTQPQGTSTPAAAGTMESNSVTVFTLSLQPNSVAGCVLMDPSMTRPVSLTTTNNSAVLLTSGGIHYDLSRVAPNVYAEGYWVKIRADLSTRPKRLT